MLGFDLCLSRDTGNTIYRLGFYEAGTLDVMRRCLRPDDVFVDAGASIGLMTLLASDLVGPQGRVLAFEPLPKRYRQLATSVRRNGRSNITAFPAGLASRPRVLKIFLDRPSPSMVQRDPSERCEISEVRVLDDVLRSEAVREVRMLKLDVEGFELEVLHGARELLSSPRAPILSVEYGVYRDESQGILDFLASVNRYRFFHLEHRKATPSPLREIDMRRGPLVGDNIFCFLDHHLTGPAAASLTLG